MALCEIAKSSALVLGEVVDWSNDVETHSLTGYSPDIWYTRLTVNVEGVERGPLELGKHSVLLVGSVDEDAMSEAGPLTVGGERVAAYFFIDIVDNTLLVREQGYFWRSGEEVRNVGMFGGGVNEQEFLEAEAEARLLEPCP
jgi:hypothetical protein